MYAISWGPNTQRKFVKSENRTFILELRDIFNAIKNHHNLNGDSECPEFPFIGTTNLWRLDPKTQEFILWNGK